LNVLLYNKSVMKRIVLYIEQPIIVGSEGAILM